jgi:hypothetical protein
MVHGPDASLVEQCSLTAAMAARRLLRYGNDSAPPEPAMNQEEKPSNRRRAWVRPLARRLRSDTADAGTGPGNDGSGNS